MTQQALGMLETIGFTTAVSAADAALKAAEVRLEAVEKVIGVGGIVSVTIHLSGDVAAVKSAVDAGSSEAERIGKLVSAHVIPRVHEELTGKVLPLFERLEQKQSTASQQGKSRAPSRTVQQSKARNNPEQET